MLGANDSQKVMNHGQRD